MYCQNNLGDKKTVVRFRGVNRVEIG